MMTYNLWKRILSVCLCLVLFASLFPGLRASAQQGGEVVVSSQANNTLRQLAEELSLEIGKLPTTGALRNCRVLLTGFTQTLSGSNDMKDLRGKHYLIRTDVNSYVLDGSWTGSNGNLPMKAVTISGYSVTSGASPATAFDFHYRGLDSNGRPLYVLRFNNGRNLGIGTRYTDWPELYYVKADTTTDLSKAPTVMLDHPDAESWFRISNATGTHGFRQSSDLTCFRWKDNSAGDNEFQGNVLELYRLWSTREIITAIHDMRGYLEVPEFYDEAVFSEFLTCMRQAIDLFKQYNPTPNTTVDPYDFVQEKLDQKEAELRSFASRLNLDFQAPSAAELDKKTTIHQLPLACGYVIRTREGKIIIIDGGWQENNTEGKYLFSYLQKITGDSTPHIDAWFITHAHADHHGCVPTFANLYKNQVTIDAFYYHYPTYDQIKTYLSGCGVEDTWGAVDWIPTWLMPNFRNAEGGPTKGIICNTEHSGLCNNSFDFDEVHIDILLTFDDVAWAADNVSGRYSGTSANEGRVFSNKTFKELLNDNFNETSMVFRVTVGGKNVLFTGDINYIGGYMLDKFHTAYTQNNSNYYSIKSDYVQVSHHGHYGLPKKVYNKIDPDVAMWPCNYDEWNDYDYQNLICTKQWFSDMGAKNYIAYQGPQVFEFPPVRTEGAITVPAELKDYVFDAKYYRDKYADLAKLYGNDENKLYYHFLSYGIEEGRSASPFFDVRFYANQNGAHLRDTFKGNYVAAFKDFLNKYKTSTLMKLSENFDAKVYAAAHKDLEGQGDTTNFALLKHYTENGYKTGEIASTTFATLEPNVTYHDNCTVTQPVAPTCSTVGKTAGVECTACGLVLKSQTVVPTTGHSYTYTKIDDQSHTVGCKNCSLSETAPHSYENGLCICGAEEVKEPVLETGWKLGHTLNLASDISVNLAVSKSLLAGFDMDTVYILAEIDLYTGNEKTGTKTVKLLPVEQGDYYYFTLSGLTAINMNDRIRSVLYGTKDGQEYFSPTDDYSIADYAYSQMNKSAAVPDKLKVLCAELLRYGAKAQIYKNYRVNELADSHMTDAHKALLSDIDAVVFGNTNQTLDDLADASVKWIGKSLILDSKVCLKFIFSKGTYAGDVSELSLHVSYTDTYGATKETVLTVAELYNEKLSYYSFTLDTMLAAELRSVVSVQVYSGNTPVSATLQYSADTYGNGKTGNLLQLCKALIAYSDSANAFFTA